jgi:hypothetical protein
VDILYFILITCQLFDLRVFSKQFDGLSNDWLIELAFGVDRISPETDSYHSDTTYGKIREALEWPVQHLQHPSQMNTINSINKLMIINTINSHELIDITTTTA